jgi:predicted dehydrogenase
MHLARPDQVRLGIVGACGRGGSVRRVLEALPDLTIQAVCDLKADELHEMAQTLRAEEEYIDYAEMLSHARLDAVLIGTPMPLHVPQAIMALRAGLHVLSEVPAGVSIEECRELVAACKQSKGLYMLAENYIYHRPNLIVREMVRQGLFGATYYAEGEYLHELKELNERTPWRRKWQTGIDGITYGTHSLGPILQWMPGDRVTAVTCAGSGHHYRDPRGALYENQDSCVMLCQMRSDGLAKVRVDMLSERPHAMNNHVLQGSEGAYESARTSGERNRIWLKQRSPERNQWQDLEELAEEFTPEWVRAGQTAAGQAGHGGSDYYVLRAFLDAVQGKRPLALGIHEAMDMTLPGLVSQQSIQQGGQWLPVPDSRGW